MGRSERKALPCGSPSDLVKEGSCSQGRFMRWVCFRLYWLVAVWVLFGGGNLLLGQAITPVPSQLENQAVFTTSTFDIQSSKATPSRISGFFVEGTFYIAFGISSTSGFDTQHGPGLFYGLADSILENPTQLSFSGEDKIQLQDLVKQGSNDQFQMAATLIDGVPFVFWIHTIGTGGSNINQFAATRIQPPLVSGAPPSVVGDPVVFDTSKILTTTTTSTVAFTQALDTAIASLGDQAYLFVLQSDPVNRIVVLATDGESVAFQENIDFGETVAFGSIDACNVTLSSGEEAVLIAFTQQPAGEPVSQIQMVVWQPGGNTLPLVVAPPDVTPTIGYTNASVRVGYGPINSTNVNFADPTNAATLYYNIPVNASRQVQPCLLQVNLPDSFAVGGTGPVLAGSSAGGWSIQTSGLSTQSYTADVTLVTVFPASMPAGSGTFNTVHQFQTLCILGGNADENTKENNYISSMFTLRLEAQSNSPNGPFATQSWTDYPPGLTPEEQESWQASLVQSWLLLGVITGLPPAPLPRESLIGEGSLQISYSTSTTDASTQTSKTSFGISGGFKGAAKGFELNVGSGYGQMAASGVTQQTSYSVTYSEQYEDPNRGWLVVLQPNYYNGLYEVQAYDGTSLDMQIFCSWPDGGNVLSIPFVLTNPNTPVPGYPKSVYTFPVDTASGRPVIRWPRTGDLDGWMSPPLPNELGTVPGSKNTNLYTDGQGINAQIGATQTLGVSGSNLVTFTTDSEQKVNVEGGVSLFGFSVKGNYEWSWLNQSKATFDEDNAITVQYPALNPNWGYSYLNISLILNQLAQSPSEVPNWIPTIFSGSNPWLITWKVQQKTPVVGGTGTDAIFGTYLANPLFNDLGWFYFPRFYQMIYRKNVGDWGYMLLPQTWVMAHPAATPDNLILYHNRSDRWYWTSEYHFPFVFDLEAEHWRSAW